MKVIRYPERKYWHSLIRRLPYKWQKLETQVKRIFSEVEKNGDEALFKYTSQFDHLVLRNIQVSQEEISRSSQLLDRELAEAIQLAADNIDRFHRAQFIHEPVVETMPGVTCWRKWLPIEKVGLYIPGGSAPLFSTVLMLAIPAKIAGCREIILCTPPRENEAVHPAILYAAYLTGVKKIYRIGGIQAIAAMALGTQTIPKVYKIFGPGNQYVTAAKQFASQRHVAVDMPAGPSEVAIIADRSGDPEFIASDLLSQAEHGITSQVVLASADEEIINMTIVELERQLVELPRKEIAEKSLNNSKAFLFRSIDEAIGFINCYAPEHLILMVENAYETAELITNAGSVFIGNYTPEAAGDYATGTNHTLPTNGFARSYSGLSLESFMKTITFQTITREGLKNIGPSIEKMAESEGLYAHKNAVHIRMQRSQGL